jgi:hypothetical protein
MRKVTLLHFLLSAGVLLVIIVFFSKAHGFSGPPAARLNFEAHVAWSNAWGRTWAAVFCILQPQIWLADKFGSLNSSTIPIWITLPVWFISIPVWSLCFGWFFVKMDNWLNHFPIFGKKVF